ncbi:hypothetical protein PISMIDRAFT_466713 [Pisolithus microcarpus 441]|uniref:Uncharacterized protein n=1 Tax=Pisolithus microcarpus 441 TaxID=765257 RepID=A0A0C9ZBG2_9AGAM|nr:hypothetical protein BKA83DRAFT_466713 [Pisolithus microcarpus]KIK23284.1 hypothetical protein PISMIDRAFT_466713 [Pisolithus microcarpus 441]
MRDLTYNRYSERRRSPSVPVPAQPAKPQAQCHHLPNPFFRSTRTWMMASSSLKNTLSVGISTQSNRWVVADRDSPMLTGSTQEFESKIMVTETEHADTFVYAVASNDKNAKTYKIVIGPVQVDVAVDITNL